MITNSKIKKVIMLSHDGGELANQLWTSASLYAFSKEIDAQYENYSFFEYGKYFNPQVVPQSFFASILFRLPINFKRRSGISSKIFRTIYKTVQVFLKPLIYKNLIPSSCDGGIYYLPPTKDFNLPNVIYSKKYLYFTSVSGGVFRNPVGMEKYRNDIVHYFSPNTKIEKKVSSIINEIRRNFKKVVGIHIRQTDYKEFKGGKYFISQEKVVSIAREYLEINGIKKEDVCFLITSDGAIDESLWNGLNIYVSKENMVTDLFLLSSADAVIGSDSTFGHFAAYYGNIPHIIMKNEPIDWNFYKDKNCFFWNKYLTVMLV
jgi:hypothetical protein